MQEKNNHMKKYFIFKPVSSKLLAGFLLFILSISLYLPLPIRATELPKGFTDYKWPTLDNLESTAYLVADLDSGEIILDHNSDKEVYPASITKLLTALTILEHPNYDPERMVQVSEHALDLNPEANVSGYQLGEMVPTSVALYASIIYSANDLTRALAEGYAETEESFLGLMQQKAQEIGCENTTYTDVCGFGDESHHTIAKDVLKVVQALRKHSEFLDMAKRSWLVLPPSESHPFTGWKILQNTNMPVILGNGLDYTSPYIKSFDGGKTGTTEMAGECIVTMATTYDNRHLVAMVFNAHMAGDTNYEYERGVWIRALLEEGAKKINAPQGTGIARNEQVPANNDSDLNPTVAKAEAEANSSEAKTQLVENDWRNPKTITLLIALGMAFLCLFLLLVAISKIQRWRNRYYRAVEYIQREYPRTRGRR